MSRRHAIAALGLFVAIASSALATNASAATAKTTVMLGASLGFERMDGDAIAVLTPYFGLIAGPLSVDLAPALRLVAMSKRGDDGRRDAGLRDADWDERAEWLRPLRRLTIATDDGQVGLQISGLDGLSVGRGTLIDDYRAAFLQDHYRAAAHAFARAGPVEAEFFANDVTALQVIGTRLGVQPLARGAAATATGLRSWGLAFEAAADRNAPTQRQVQGGHAVIGKDGRSAFFASAWVAAVVETSLVLARRRGYSAGLWSSFGVANQAGHSGRGGEIGFAFDVRADDDDRSLIRLALAPGWAQGIWLPQRLDGAYELERLDLARAPTAGGVRVNETLAQRMAAVDADGGLGGVGRGHLRLEPIAGWITTAEARLAPTSKHDLTTWSLRTAWVQPDWWLRAGWLRRPGRLHLFAGSAGFRPFGAFSVGVRLERAMHADGARGLGMAPSWDGGGWVAVDLP